MQKSTSFGSVAHGFISTYVASNAENNLYKFLICSIAYCLTVYNLSESTILFAISSVKPKAKSIGSTMILFGSFFATSSISTPPLIEATIAGF